MKLIKEYMCDNETPSNKEIEEAVNIATAENCIVKLYWYYPYSGDYVVCIKPNATVKEVKEQLPRCYPI